nr:hypothetical protein BaRGS_023869 [Batillaria attramentaria]
MDSGQDNDDHVHRQPLLTEENDRGSADESEDCRPSEDSSPRSRSRALSRSWSAGGQGSDSRQNSHDTSPSHDSTTDVKKHLISSLNLDYHRNGHPGMNVSFHDTRPSQTLAPSDDNGKMEVKEAERQRLKRRLMASSFVTLVCYITGYLSLVPIQAQYLYQRFAQDYFNLTNVTEKQVPCAENSNDSLQEILNQIQADTSRQTLYMDYAQYAPAIFVALLLGSYTDYLGRRFMVFMPCFGAFLKSVVFLLVIYLELDVNYLYIAFAADGVCGSIYALTLGLTAAVADITTTSKERALTFALLEGSLAIAGSVSQIGAGFLIDAVGYVAPAVVVAVLLFLATVSVVLFMPETLHRPAEIVLNPAVHLRKVFGFYILDGTVRQRCLFLCGLMAYFFVILVSLGKLSVETLYELNTPFCWDSVQIGLFGGLKMLVQVTGSVAAVKVLQACMRIEFIGLLGLVSGMASFMVEAFAFSDWMMYLVPVTGIISMLVGPITRTLMSRMAPSNSQGALFASMSAIETVCHLASTTMYNTVYMATLDVFSGAVFLLMASFCFINFILIV